MFEYFIFRIQVRIRRIASDLRAVSFRFHLTAVSTAGNHAGSILRVCMHVTSRMHVVNGVGIASLGGKCPEEFILVYDICCDRTGSIDVDRNCISVSVKCIVLITASCIHHVFCFRSKHTRCIGHCFSNLCHNKQRCRPDIFQIHQLVLVPDIFLKFQWKLLIPFVCPIHILKDYHQPLFFAFVVFRFFEFHDLFIDHICSKQFLDQADYLLNLIIFFVAQIRLFLKTTDFFSCLVVTCTSMYMFIRMFQFWILW